jgi:hypothetical protein
MLISSQQTFMVTPRIMFDQMFGRCMAHSTIKMSSSIPKVKRVRPNIEEGHTMSNRIEKKKPKQDTLN